MADVRPFRVLRPSDAVAGEVIAPPYDVLSDQQARALATNRRNFVRVTRSEVDLAPGVDPHSEEAYRQARVNLDAFREDGTLVQDEAPTYLLYGQTMGDHTQIGVIAACSVDEYDQGHIAKHEFTRPDKEDDRTHHMEVLDAQVGLVFLAHRPSAALDEVVTRLSAAPPAWEVTTEDGVVHRCWRAPTTAVPELRDAFAAMPRLYIADGHHRSAAASRVHANRKSDRSGWFLAGLYPSDRLQVLAYNRVVQHLNGRDSSSFLAAVSERWEVTETTSDTPGRRGEIRMYLGQQWFDLRLRPAHHSEDPVEALDCAALQTHLLGPLLGVDNPRTCEHIRFVGGIHGPSALKQAVDGGDAVAFHLFPTGLDQLFEVADAGQVMPPKSTWFEPKLREGVAIRLL